MSKNVTNKLKALFAATILVLVAFNLVAFLVPFNAKYGSVFWASYISGVAAIVSVLIIISIPLNNNEFKNDECGNKVFLFSLLFLAVQLAAGIIFMAVAQNIKDWLGAILVSFIFVILLFINILVLIHNNASKDDAE